MFTFVLFLFLQLIYFIAAHPDENLSITQFIKKYNYPVEVHNVQTSDGYILTLQRIPRGTSNRKSREVVLLVHGMAGSAENFIILGPSDALSFYLADRGYDVWLFNARGTAHSRKHRSLNPNIDSRKFWNFSWHEIGVIDLPTSINYILLKTGKHKLHYVGHSQGTTSLFVMLSEVPEMNEKIKVAVLLAAVVKFNLTPYPVLSLLTKFVPFGQRLFDLLNWHELAMPNSPMFNRIMKSLCKTKLMSDICIDILNIVGGTDSGYFNKTLLPTFLETSPSGFAVRQLWHYGQITATGEFKQYDFGKKKNLKLYNTTKPPFYNLSNAKIPFGIFYGNGDLFADEKVSSELANLLPNVPMFYEIKPDGFNHMDFLIGANAREAVYDPLYKLFQEFEDIINI